MTQLTIEPIPTGWRAFYDPEGLVGEGVDREAAIVDLLEKTDEALDKTLTAQSLRARALVDVTRERDEAVWDKHIKLTQRAEAALKWPGCASNGHKPAPNEAAAALVAFGHADKVLDEIGKAMDSAPVVDVPMKSQLAARLRTAICERFPIEGPCSPACGCIAINDVAVLLEAESPPKRQIPDPLGDALNSGDGSYKP